MPLQPIDTATQQPNGKIGDPAKTAFEKVNANDAYLEDLANAKATPANITAAVAAEAVLRSDADTGLSNAIAAEALARQTADAVLQAQLHGRNMLINCGVPINQRAFAGGALAAGVFGYDRWFAGPGGCNFTVNATTGVWTHTSGPVRQCIEAPELAWGLPLTISVEDPSGDVAVSVGGSTGTIPAGSGRKSVTLTPTGSGNMVVQLTATGATYKRPQLERGSAATAFESRQIGFESLLCNRYFWRSEYLSGSARVTAAKYSATAAIGFIIFPVPMRDTPAATASVNFLFSPNGGTFVSQSIVGQTRYQAALTVNTSAGSANQGGYVGSTATGYIDFDAEITS